MSEQRLSEYKTADLTLDDRGILTVRFHSRGGSLRWNALPHREFQALFTEIGSRRDVRVVVLIGTGDRFIVMDPQFEGTIATGASRPADWDEGVWEGRLMLHRLLDIDVPVIAAINGPVDVHAEIALLSDIVIAADDAWLSDEAHLPNGLAPADGVQIIWPLLLGVNRGRYFLLTGERIGADEAKQLGLVSEVLPSHLLLTRAMEHAERLAELNPAVLHATRRAVIRPIRALFAQELEAGLALESLASLAGAPWSGVVRPRPLAPVGSAESEVDVS